MHMQKMSKLCKQRKEKLFCEFQTHQQHMCDLLQSQITQATSNEDERLARTIAEQDAKKFVSRTDHIDTLDF